MACFTGNHLWLPYTQMQTTAPPLIASHTSGSTIILEDGRQLVDGVASWWTACHGYNHPAIASRVRHQLSEMPHIMLGGMVHRPALALSEELSARLPGDLDHVFFSDSGSVSVEVALKMAIQFWLNEGKPSKTRILSFRGGYHGDTQATMAICDPEEGMHNLFAGVLPRQYAQHLPLTSEDEADLEHVLEQAEGNIAAMIIEPLVQGAGGMIFHPPSVLRKLRRLADRHNILLIFDEVFTGFGRTGTMFACEQAGITPDIMTLSKALTGGTMALAATVARRHVFDAFLSDDPKAALMHGPTFMGNPLACAAACASLDLFRTEPRLAQIAAISEIMRRELEKCRHLSGVRDVRVLGAIGVVEIEAIGDMNRLKAALIDAGVWVRPFRNIIYLTPAFTIEEAALRFLTDSIFKVVQAGAFRKIG